MLISVLSFFNKVRDLWSTVGNIKSASKGLVPSMKSTDKGDTQVTKEIKSKVKNVKNKTKPTDLDGTIKRLRKHKL